ncbi:sel1 repeat family protein [Pseudomonas sp. WJP1]|uniref:sel1 repeat family protein n=1 Tax=Pseudomonas sp. WJP1 TaxID=2986947 RepID=UPI00234976E3|nr:sel1 repeat family protein [Pseudomonas sp. WJP1]WCM53272.1 sel1 repeat family protein [Pseudomonas sp. WJP1]
MAGNQMFEPATPPANRKRLNPFPFPSDTTLRFILLVVFIVCGSARIWGGLSEATDPAIDECVRAVSTGVSELPALSRGDPDQIATTVWNELIPLHASCAARLRPGAFWKLGGMALVVLLAVILYHLYPAWKVRNGRLERFSSTELPEMQQELRILAESARLSEPPIFVWNPLGAGLPVAFGRHGKCYVALSGAFITQYFYGDRDAFRAIMQHELAHVHNGDVHKAYFTLSLWLAFVVTSLLPALAMSLWRLTSARWLDSVPLLLDSMLWTAVIVLSGLAVLRARECYADVQASAWDPDAGIDRVLATLTEPVGNGWRRYLQFHPGPGRRRQIVEDPSRLFKFGIADAFGIGIAAWSVVEIVSGLALPFVPADPRMALLFYWSLQIVAPAAIFVFAIGAIGVGVWRSAFASLVQGDRWSKETAWLGGAFVAGSFPGIILLLAEAALQSFQETAIPFSVVLTSLQLKVLVYVILLLGCLLIFSWISAAASAWFEVVLRSRSPQPILLITVATATILVLGTLTVATFFVLYFFLTGPSPQGQTNRIYDYGMTVGAWTFVASLTAWSFPLAALWWQKKGLKTEIARWVFLDNALPELPEQLPLRAQKALLIGIVNGLICCLLWELVLFRDYFPPPISNWIGSAFDAVLTWTERLFGNKGIFIPGSAVIFQALAAAIAAARVRRLSAICGLFAASVAGLIIVVGNHILFGFELQNQWGSQIFASLQLMGLGAVVALPTALLVAWTANKARRYFLNTVVPRASGRQIGHSFHARIKLAGIIILCVLVAAGATLQALQPQIQSGKINSLRVAAERGDRDAQFMLGRSYFRGESVSQDFAQALLWLRKAAELGHADAQYDLALMFHLGQGVTQDDSVAFHWIRMAAEQGHVEAEYVLGTLYGSGLGVPRDDSLALQWLRRAAEKGNAEAQNLVGYFLAVGRGTTQDDAAAVEWLRKAAEHGHAEAQNNLGLMYHQGRGLPKDDVLALRWFRTAAEKGHAAAQINVGQIYEKGEGVARDDEQAIFWLRKATENGNSDAMNRLQALCDKGLRNACSK